MGFPGIFLEHVLLAVLLAAELMNTLVIAQDSPALDGLKATFNDPFLNNNWIGFPCNETDPSRWFGIQCTSGRVTGIVLEDMGLTGKIDVNAFFSLTELSVLSLKSNSLKGNVMDFSDNHHLKYIDLSGNEFDGPIPRSLLNLNLLETLLLQDNKLTGPIPEFSQPSLKMINVSGNDLHGRIQVTQTFRSLGPPSLNSFSSSLKASIPTPTDNLHLNAKPNNTTDAPHGNLKSSNVLLDENDTVLISDYGLSTLIAQSIVAQRLVVYKSPEYGYARKVSKQSDVWSYGSLLIELLTGRLSACSAPPGVTGSDLCSWVHRAVREEWTAEIFDKEISTQRSALPGMLRLLQIAMRCTDRFPENRPDMREVVREVEKIEVVPLTSEDEEDVSGDRSMTDDSLYSTSTTTSGIVGDDRSR